MTQDIVSSGPSSLNTPVNLKAESISDSSFSLSWTGDANAADYAVSLSPSGGSIDVSGTSATVTNLFPDTTYTVLVMALPSSGSTDYTESGWSAPISVPTLLAGGLLRTTLLEENFTNSTAGWTSSSYYHSKIADAGTWTDLEGCTNIANAKSAIVIGRANKDGCAISPEITLTNVTSGTVTISFDTASYVGKSTSGSLSIVAADTDAIISVVTNFAPTALDSDAAAVSDANVRIVATDVEVASPFRLRFDSFKGSDGNYQRLYLDSILVTQIYDPNYAVLAAPTGVTSNDVGKTGFTVEWSPVENASGYEVWLDGAPYGSCASTETSMPITGRGPGTPYTVEVKALGDNLHYGDSGFSSPISVTTLADAQKIDFTVTGAPTAPVYAGDPVSFTVAATNEATQEAAPVAFSSASIANATFVDGAFSWTPTESDVGSHTAVFSSGDYSTNVAITVSSAMITKPLNTENFTNITSTSWSSTTGYTNKLAGDIGTWTGLDLIKTKSAVIVGRAGSSGTIVSPEIALPSRTPGSLSISFDTGSLNGKKASVQAQILDTADGSVLYTTNFPTVAELPAAALTVADAGARYTVAPGADVALPASIKFALTTYQSAGDDSFRAYVDTVVFEQVVSAKLRDLAAPNGLAVAEGSVSTNGFTVGWNEVGNATNYAVRVTDATGAIAFSAPFCAVPPLAVAGLADDEDYAVQVRATGDETLFFASAWSAPLAVRTERSPLHPTLSFGPWTNAAKDGKVHGGIVNTATVSALRDNESNAVVTLVSVSPVPDAGPTLSDGVLSWTPADADTNKTFTLRFLMDGTYATNLAFHVFSVPALEPPVVTVGEVAWNAIPLSWDAQMRAARYGVRVWTDCPNPGATSSRVEENFANWPAAKPFGWEFDVSSGSYKNASAPVKFDTDGQWMATFDLGGVITNVSFTCKGASMKAKDGKDSVLTLYWSAGGTNEADWIGNPIVSASNLVSSQTRVTGAISPDSGARLVVWRYSRGEGGVGVGSVVVEGEGFTTPRWLPGWGSAAKDVGLAQDCTVEKPRPGRVLGVDPSDPREDLIDPRVHYAEVRAVDASGNWLATIVEAPVPAPPRSVRATMMILK